MFDATVVMEAIVMLVCLVITRYLVPFIKSKTTASQQNEIQFWVNVAVEYAEQTMKSSAGKERKAEVIRWLEEHGITYDSNKLDVMIESAVYRLTNKTTITVKEK